MIELSSLPNLPSNSNSPSSLSKIVVWAHCQLGTSETSALQETLHEDFVPGVYYTIWCPFQSKIELQGRRYKVYKEITFIDLRAWERKSASVLYIMHLMSLVPYRWRNLHCSLSPVSLRLQGFLKT